MMNNWGGMGSGGWIIALLILVVAVAVIIAIVYLVRGMGAGSAGAGSPSSDQPARIAAGRPQETLRGRRDDRAEYEEKMRDLSS